jgi:hypothetical protein
LFRSRLGTLQSRAVDLAPIAICDPTAQME